MGFRQEFDRCAIRRANHAHPLPQSQSGLVATHRWPGNYLFLTFVSLDGRLQKDTQGVKGLGREAVNPGCFRHYATNE